MSAHEEGPAPLGGEARRILDAGRGAERLSARRKAQLRGRVMAAVAAGAGTAGALSGAAAGTSSLAGAAAETASLGAAAETASLGAAAKAAGVSLFAKVGLAVAVTTIGAGGLLWSRANQGPPAALTTQDVSEAAQAPSGQALSDAPAASQAPAPAAPADEASAAVAPPAASLGGVGGSGPAAPQPVAAASSTPKPSSTTEAGTAAAADSLPEETRLLAAVHAALSRGDAAAALALLDEHAARFPRGALVPERRAARAMTLCKLGRAADGRSEAGALYGEGSNSPLADKIRRACAK